MYIKLAVTQRSCNAQLTISSVCACMTLLLMGTVRVAFLIPKAVAIPADGFFQFGLRVPRTGGPPLRLQFWCEGICDAIKR